MPRKNWAERIWTAEEIASDYPIWDGLFPNAVSTLRKRTDVSENAKQKILTDNAKRFYVWQS
jgi:predicted TIM-barrel fold metal-dependent hydrolase